MSPADLYLSSLAPSTRRTAGGDLRTLAAMAWPGPSGQRADARWETLGVDQGAAVRAALAARYAPGTANRMLTVLRGVLKSAWIGQLLPWDAYVRLLGVLPQVRGGRVGRGRALPWHELQHLLEAGRDPEERALLALASGGGLRRDELLRLTWDRCKPTGDGTWYVTVLGKGNKERRLRLPSWAGRLLAVWHQRSGHPTSGRVFHWRDGKSVWRVVFRCARNAGVGALAPHDLRRTFASLALSTGIGTADLRRMMGHASINTTVKYDRRPDAEALEAAAKLDGLTPRIEDGSPGGEDDGSRT